MGLPHPLVGYFGFFKNLTTWTSRLRDKSRESISVWKMHCPRQGKGEREGDGGNKACALFIKSVRGYRADLQLCLPWDARSQPVLHGKVFPSRKAENTFCDTGKH